MPIRKVTRLPHKGVDLAKEFVGTIGEEELADKKNKEYGLAKKSHGYLIFSMKD